MGSLELLRRENCKGTPQAPVAAEGAGEVREGSEGKQVPA